MNNEDVSFVNMDMWKGSGDKFGLTFKQIILQHINRCVLHGSVEWHGGYWQEKFNGNTLEKYYVQNSREVYCNSIRMLRVILLGYFDSKIKITDEEITKQMKILELSSLEKDKTKIKEYYEKKLDLYIRLFEELVVLSKRLNFFEEEETVEEVR